MTFAMHSRQMQALVMLLLFEKHVKREESFWSPYICSLPTSVGLVPNTSTLCFAAMHASTYPRNVPLTSLGCEPDFLGDWSDTELEELQDAGMLHTAAELHESGPASPAPPKQTQCCRVVSAINVDLPRFAELRRGYEEDFVEIVNSFCAARGNCTVAALVSQLRLCTLMDYKWAWLCVRSRWVSA